ncbi:translation elongation factor Ts [Rickettsiales endosymbiont of Stachyamoeba lipophora]|uniref:translation elongation factor Ts n=1 Tax=Rickettsiales endosymbiont of Stachyamoeba lipophora TaxID=2486578 RepID=UPI000F6508CB|nr:translation elongation factor Ts [Rickettsiales endosymbiont of Stachyamoeba lipophora]AZL15076.1 elongation factor Ts [Rickettsiales endosymbiont of Stachyamoeba lipophora]
MSEITSQMIKELREKTGAGMMDCKKALTENNANFEEAVDWLRAKGLAAAAKKASRVAAEGLVAVKVEGNFGVAVEINSETDFVAKNDQFITICADIAAIAFKTKATDIEVIKAERLTNNNTVEEEITNKIAVIGENINLRRIGQVQVTNGVVGHYIHNAAAENMGRIGVLIGLESTGNQEKLSQLAKQIAMHIAAARPESLTIDELDTSLVARERDIAAEQSRASGKPENIIEKMVEGRVRKFYEEAVLLEQVFVIDGKTKIKDAVAELAKELGTEVKISSFVRFNLGEGIEHQQSDFANEVAQMAGIKN